VYANPAEEQGAIWIVVASAGGMSQLTGYATNVRHEHDDSGFKLLACATT